MLDKKAIINPILGELLSSAHPSIHGTIIRIGYNHYKIIIYLMNYAICASPIQ